MIAAIFLSAFCFPKRPTINPLRFYW